MHPIILNKIYNLFLEELNAQDKDIDQQAMDAFFLGIAEVSVLLNGIFFFAFRQGVQATDEECDNMDSMCRLFGLAWRRLFHNKHLTHKFHLIECHLSEQFRRLRSLGEWTEEPIERVHHHYKVFRSTYLNVREWKAIQELIYRNMNLRRRPGIQTITKQIIASTARGKSLKTTTKEKENQERQESISNLSREEDIVAKIALFLFNS